MTRIFNETRWIERLRQKKKVSAKIRLISSKIKILRRKLFGHLKDKRDLGYLKTLLRASISKVTLFNSLW